MKRNLIHNKEKQRDWFFQIKRKFLKIFFFIKISNIHKLIKLREKRKFYPISKALIEYKLNKLLKINNCNSLFRVTVLKKDTFLIEKNKDDTFFRKGNKLNYLLYYFNFTL